MEYICHKRFKGKAFYGDANIPYGTKLYVKEGILYTNTNEPICYVTSQVAYDHFAVNDDEQGLKRGELTSEIIKTLAVKDDKYQTRWDKIWSDISLLRYKRIEYDDYWLWNFSFFNASIVDLEKIYNMIKGV